MAGGQLVDHARRDARSRGLGVGEKDFLEAAAERWKKLDAVEYPFTRKVADHL
ncbi:hypothetical protein [Hyalangium versicolor]|uniref:hypothetical protein n=1 Tax=Hyalangium versicolor TaxID=2861190 RepID=UPI001CCD9975|nr:hypothetical protein [Hyalangium versicolor]